MCPLTNIIIIIIIVTTNIIIPKNNEVPGKSRRLQIEELCDLHSLPSIIRVIKSVTMRREGHVARVGDRRGAYRILVEYIERKTSLGRPRRRRLCNIKLDLQGVE